jgi:hypothetical protein
VTALEQLPVRFDAQEMQILQLQREMHAECSAVGEEIGAGDEETRRVLGAEIRAGDEETRRVLGEEIDATQRPMRVLHEDVIARIALLQEGSNRPRKKKR